ncbi:MAG: insulinase family protein [Sphingomonadales bacterium]|nr:insulinase family protein [Sphingomonadales bacterium]MDE2569310.1 insulinase family protein [Sphingomonadales bacterium]
MRAAVATSLIALTLVAAPAQADPASNANVPLKQEGKWAQDYTGRQADPAVLFGTLPNGLRYAIMHNTTPSDGVAMRMRIGSGSIEESADQQGLAHFLEHMAFRGSTNVPDGEVVKMLERQGLRFGADTNAFTAQDETVYMFNFPTADRTALDTGFKLFREIGGRLTLAKSAIDAERGVILSEERLRDTPPYRSIKANFDNALNGTRAVERWPIGTIASIKDATPARLRSYYEANYRPGNATIIVVGNVDPKAVEQEIKARFSDWKPAGKAASVTEGTPEPEHKAAEYVANGVRDQLWLEWVKPDDDRAETLVTDREQLLRMVALTALDNRLSDAASKAGAPFVGADTGSIPNLFGSASVTLIQITAAPDKWQGALDAVTEEQRRLLTGGITPDELKRAITVVRTQLQNAADTAATRKNDAIADSLVSTTNSGDLFTSPAQDLAFAAPILAAITPQEADGALKAAFSGVGPVLFRSAQNGPATEPVLAAALTQAYQRPLAARAAQAAISWPYTEFGKPNPVVSQVTDRDLGATLVTFAGGTRLLVKQTPFEKDKIHVSVQLGDGRAGTPKDMSHALWTANLFPLGGTGKLSNGQIDRWSQTTGKVVSAALAAHNGAFALSGLTRKADLASEMQLLAAYARDPGYRPEMGDKIGAVGPMIDGQVGANAGAVFFRGLQQVTSGGDDRYLTIPTPEQIAATRPGDVPVLLGKALAGPADVVMVGDVSLDDAIKATKDTFAAGPARPAVAPAKPQVTMAPGRTAPWVFTHSGRADQAFFGEFWPAPDYFADPRASYVADVAAAVLQSRLIDQVREKLGLTYSPMVSAEASLEVSGLGYFGAAIETPAANFDTYKAIVDEQMADLAARPVSADELERARKPLVEAAGKDLEDNGYWAKMLSLYVRDPRIKAPALDRAEGLRGVTAADVAAFVAKFVKDRTPETIVSRAK